MSDLEIAGAIVEALFTNGFGQKAQRLVLELHDSRYGGGWCGLAVRDQILRVLADSRNEAGIRRRIECTPQ